MSPHSESYRWSFQTGKHEAFEDLKCRHKAIGLHSPAYTLDTVAIHMQIMPKADLSFDFRTFLCQMDNFGSDRSPQSVKFVHQEQPA